MLRKELLAGLTLAASAVLVVLIGGWLDLEVTSTVLLGAAAGAVVGLVPDRSAAVRIGGFAAGVLISWIGYFIRAGLLPDTEGGRAVTFALVLLVATGVTVASMGRLPLWSLLLGVGVFAGAYEAAYTVAPPLVLDSSVSTATTLLLTVAIGFMAVSWFGPERRAEHVSRPRQQRAATPDSPRTLQDDDTVALNSMMGNTR